MPAWKLLQDGASRWPWPSLVLLKSTYLCGALAFMRRCALLSPELLGAVLGAAAAGGITNPATSNKTANKKSALVAFLFAYFN